MKKQTGWSLTPKFIIALVPLLCFATGLFAQGQLQITTSSLPGGVVSTPGTPYPPQVLAATGGTAPYTWSLCTAPQCPSSGSLPPGLTLSSGGVIDGTPATAGTFNFVVKVTDTTPATPQTALKSFSIIVAAPLSIDPAPLLDGKVGTAYPQQVLIADGGTPPNSWSVVSGALPSGLSLSTAGVISGTPALAGTFKFRVRVVDTSTPAQSATTPLTAPLTITVQPTITTSSLPNGTVGKLYSPQTLTASPATTSLTWSLVSGSLPAGLTLSASDGIISGTPTAAGTFNVTIGITDGSTPPLTASKALTILIQPVLTITTASELPLGMVSVFYSRQISATGPTPLTWSVIAGTLPPGTTLASNGSLSGTPSVAGGFDFLVQAAGGDPNQTASKAFSVVINRALTITTTSPLPAAALAASYNVSLAAAGGLPPYTWSTQGPLPPGLSLSTSGVLLGAPTGIGNFTFTAQVSDSFTPTQEASRAFAIAVPDKLTITTSSLPNGAVGTLYTPPTLTAAAGTAPYTWSITPQSLPQGLTISSDGSIGGTPAAAGTFNVTILVGDGSSSPQTASKVLPITIQPRLTITTALELPLAVIGVFYSRQIEASGPSPLSWSVISGSPPPGVTLSTSSGSLTGAPTVAGTFNFTVQATGGDPKQTATQNYRVVVNAPLAITTVAALPDATVGVPYSASLAATGGVPPYTWTTQDRLPPGIALSSSGVLSGTPASISQFPFAVQVSDSFTPSQEASRNFTLAVVNTLTITTTTLPNAIQNLPYSQQLQAAGGTAPLAWSVSSGALPAGLNLTSGGLLQGTPLEAGWPTITVTVIDARRTVGSREFIFVVDPPVPLFSVPGVPSTLSPTQLADVGLQLSAPHPSPISGQLILSFTSKAENPGDDPMTQFSTGSRKVTFTIPANSTTAVFPSQIVLLTGTVAGTVRLTANIENGPSDIPVATAEILPTGPQMTIVTVVRTPGGLDVQVTGYAPSRRVTSVEFAFDLKVGARTERINLVRNVDTDFTNWYRSAGSAAFGSAFSFVQSFTIQGADASAIESVTIRLTNAQGSTSSAAIRPQ